MSTMNKFKAYFGYAAPHDYDDDYISADYRETDYRDADYRETDYRDADYRGRVDRNSIDRFGRGGAYGYEESGSEFGLNRLDRLGSSGRSSDRMEAISRVPRHTPAATAMKLDDYETGSEAIGLGRIITLRPTAYSEARAIGETFREGTPVIMDLVEMTNADAKRLVDFAAGLAFALHGSVDKVATKVFLLAPMDVNVTPEDRQRIESGFYNQK